MLTNACLKTSTPTSDPSTIIESTSSLRSRPSATDPLAVTRCAATNRSCTERCTRSTMSILAAVNTFASSIFLNTCPLISPKLLETSTSSIAFVCELMATLRVTACVSKISVCAVIVASARPVSNASCAHATACAPRPSLRADALTTRNTEFCSASRTWQLKALQSLSKHSSTEHARYSLITSCPRM